MLRYLRKSNVTFLSQNVRGIKSSVGIEELIQIFAKSNKIAESLQKTWYFGNEHMNTETFI